MSTIAFCGPGDLSRQPGWPKACDALHALDTRLSVLMQHGGRQATVGYADHPVPGGPATRVVLATIDIVTDLEQFVAGYRAALALNAAVLNAGRATLAPVCGACADTGLVYRETPGYTQPHPAYPGFAHADVHEDVCGCPRGQAVALRHQEPAAVLDGF